VNLDIEKNHVQQMNTFYGGSSFVGDISRRKKLKRLNRLKEKQRLQIMLKA
jgi:hypothetical protein